MKHLPVPSAAALRKSVIAVSPLLFSTVVFAQGGRYHSDDAWMFGATADTQWTITHSLEWEDGDPYYAHVNPYYREENPDYVSVSTALKLNQEFIDHGVRFVVQLGDLTDRAGNAAMFTHAKARQPLYDAGIGFFPVRGNHETYGDLFGLDPDLDMNIPAWREAFPQTQGEGPIFDARNFTRPDEEALRGLSYSFDYGTPGSDARFLFVDVEATSYQFVPPVDHPIYGKPYTFANVFLWTVYKHDEDVLDGATGAMIPAGRWFRIASNGLPAISWVENATDETVTPDQGSWTSSGTAFHPGDQQDWITERLTDGERPVHAFVLTHRNLMGQNHLDTAWGSHPGVSPDAQNVFYRSLQENKVGYFLSAHDHMHHRSVVSSPDGNWSVEQLIATSADPKFYDPVSGTMSGQRWRETPISQELNNAGYYLFTVDGARVTVDYYADRIGNFGGDYCWPDGYAGDQGTCRDPRSNPPPERMGSLQAPNFQFVKKETWGYGQNGRRFIVPQGISYAGEVIVANGEDLEYPRISDRFERTHAEILDGFNGSVATDHIPGEPRALAKVVTTGWMANPDSDKLRSDILSLWGMAERDTEETDVYVLSMSFDTMARARHLGTGAIGIATYVDGKWVNAVDQNFGGTKRFVVGPYVEGKYPLGTYGVDPRSKTAWAVLNYNADFAVANGL